MTKKVFSMKNIFSSTKRGFSLMIMMLLASMTVTLVGCSDDSGRIESSLSDKYSNIPEEEITMFEDFAYIENKGRDRIDIFEDGKKIQKDAVVVKCALSARSFYLSRNHPNYQNLYKMLLKKEGQENIFNIKIHENGGSDGRYPILDISELSDTREKEMLKMKKPVEDNKGNISKRFNSSYTYPISYAQARDFFNEMDALDCSQSSASPCIPFKFSADGCFARAHWMRKKFKEKFGFECLKIFAFDKGRKKLSAVTRSGCTAKWGYHVAPVVTVKINDQKKHYVIDPGLFSQPVPQNEWVNKIKNVDSWVVAVGNIYVVTDDATTHYDNAYVHTKNTLNMFANMSGCN